MGGHTPYDLSQAHSRIRPRMAEAVSVLKLSASFVAVVTAALTVLVRP